MTERTIVRELLTLICAVALSASGFYFGVAGQKNRLLMTCIFLVLFLFAVVRSWYNEKRAGTQSTKRQHLMRVLLFGLLAVIYLAQAVMHPLDGWNSTRMWLFGLSWLLLAIYQLTSYRKIVIPE